jgi:hypothetical protein
LFSEWNRLEDETSAELNLPGHQGKMEGCSSFLAPFAMEPQNVSKNATQRFF